MGEIPCAYQGDPLFLCPDRKTLGVKGFGSGSGIVGMDVEIGDKFHAPQETTSRAECQPADDDSIFYSRKAAKTQMEEIMNDGTIASHQFWGFVDKEWHFSGCE